MQSLSSSDCTLAYIVEQQCFLLGKNKNLSTPIHLLKYKLDHYKDQLYSDLEIEQPQQYGSWVPKRRAQFLAGRLAAKNALCSIKKTTELQNDAILIGQHREALWPKGIIGSISHSDEISIAVAQPKSTTKLGVGVDIQSILSDDDIAKSRSLVLTARDQTLLEKGVEGQSYNQFFTLIFSAKESFFKAAFNSVGDYFDFDAVSVNSIDMDAQQLTLKCEKTLSKNIILGNRYILSFTLIEVGVPSIITYCQA